MPVFGFKAVAVIHLHHFTIAAVGSRPGNLAFGHHFYFVAGSRGHIHPFVVGFRLFEGIRPPAVGGRHPKAPYRLAERHGLQHFAVIFHIVRILKNRAHFVVYFLVLQKGIVGGDIRPAGTGLPFVICQRVEIETFFLKRHIDIRHRAFYLGGFLFGNFAHPFQNFRFRLADIFHRFLQFKQLFFQHVPLGNGNITLQQKFV